MEDLMQIDIKKFIQDNYRVADFTHLNWSGSFQEYLDIVAKNPKVARNAFQRIYDMILTHGQDEYTEYKKDIVRFRFFDDPFDSGKDAVYGIDVYLTKLVNFFKSAAYGYGTENAFCYSMAR